MSVSELSKKIRAGEPERLYYFYGRDKGAAEVFSSKLADKLCPSDDRLMNMHKFDGAKLDIEGLADACQALPFMAQRVLVVIDGLNMDQLSQSDGKDLKTILSDISPSTTVIINAAGEGIYKTKRSLTDKNRRFCEFCTKTGAVCEFAYKRSADMAKSIAETLKKAGCDISPQDAKYLAEYCLCDTSYVNNELQKLKAYAAGRTVTRADIDALCVKRVESDGYALALNILRGNAEFVFARIKELADQNYEAFEILSVIAFSLNDLYRAKLARASGHSEKECAEDFKYPANRAFAVRNAFSECANISQERLRKTLGIFSAADLKMKTSYTGKGGGITVLEQAAAQAMSLDN